MLSVHNIKKIYGIDTILDNVSFNINHGERIGLVGPNGCGKSTLLRLLAGIEKPDHGEITFKDPNIRIGFLPQGFEFDDDLSIEAVLTNRLGNNVNIDNELERLAMEISSDPENQKLQDEYDSVLQRLVDTPAIHPQALLEVLGLGDIPEDYPISYLSGGQKTRLSLANVIFKEPDFLLLDEPTNHLDIDMLIWLENWILEFSGAVLIVSHDRTFLDRTVSGIIDIDPYAHSVQEYKGNYSEYILQYQKEHEKQMQTFQDQENEIQRMKQDIAKVKGQAYWVEQTTTSREPGVRRIAKKVAKKAKSREKKLERYIDSDERVEKPRQSWQMKLEFGNASSQSQKVVTLDGLSIGYEGHEPLISNLNLTIKGGERIVVTGPNGAGKTTLMRTIAGELAPLAGRIHLGPSIRLGYMAQEQETLPLDLSPVEVIQQFAPFDETEVRSFLHYYLFSGDDPLRPVSSLSYGERSRLALAVLIAQGSNLLVMDEPINHLDIPSREQFERSLSSFKGTVLAVVHDRYFIERFATSVWFLSDRQIILSSADKIVQKRLS